MSSIVELIAHFNDRPGGDDADCGTLEAEKGVLEASDGRCDVAAAAGSAGRDNDRFPLTVAASPP